MSDYKFACSHCGQPLTATPAHAGMLIKCPACQTELRIPPPPVSAMGASAGSPQAPGAPPLIGPSAGFRPAPAPAAKSSNRGLIIGLVIGGCVLLMLLFFAIGIIFFFRAAKRQVNSHRHVRIESPAPGQGSRSYSSSSSSHIEYTPVEVDPVSIEIQNQPASGTIGGHDFKVTQAKLEGSILKLGQGGNFFAEDEIIIFLMSAGSQPEGKTILSPDPDRKYGNPHVHMRWKEENATRSTALTDKYALRLEFGEKTGNKLPGKIYLEMPEELHTKVIGTFEADVR